MLFRSDVAQKKSKARKAQPPKRKSIFDIDMSKEKKISEETLDEAGLGDAARLAHSMTGKEKALFKAGAKGSILSALRFKRSISKKQAQAAKDANEKEAEQKAVDTPTEKKDGVVSKTVKAIGRGAARSVGSVTSDLADIGTRHL